eukprot:CAMPEP_0177677716 /NCGR_PEP_ID=MMETSP0447-20121125/28576_1 /TAXON_ID=0 /ORGANISM="Stygamoeba regulata, Strain BSH-02190019" /LENGTH=75 /DNA_ID=CAMNT_0019186575 /DNA_START=72 /DNA_END=296 /DNA_ORIENTATION=+
MDCKDDDENSLKKPIQLRETVQEPEAQPEKHAQKHENNQPDQTDANDNENEADNGFPHKRARVDNTQRDLEAGQE